MAVGVPCAAGNVAGCALGPGGRAGDFDFADRSGYVGFAESPKPACRTNEGAVPIEFRNQGRHGRRESDKATRSHFSQQRGVEPFPNRASRGCDVARSGIRRSRKDGERTQSRIRRQVDGNTMVVADGFVCWPPKRTQLTNPGWVGLHAAIGLAEPGEAYGLQRGRLRC